MPSTDLPPALRLYLAVSAHGEGLARILLRRRLQDGKEDPQRIGERLGRASLPRPNGALAWFHAASVGESLSLLATIEALTRARRDLHVVVTTGTRTSATLLARRLPRRALHQFAPLDVGPAVQRFLRHWSPDLAVWTESELWPRLVHDTSMRGVPMVLVNARMTGRSMARWHQLSSVAEWLLNRFDAVLVQDEVGRAGLVSLGLESGRARVTGSLKAAAEPLPLEPAVLAQFRAAVGARPLWLAASTHPGEEAMAAAAHERLRKSRPDALLIVAPRHPDRAEAVAAELAPSGSLPRRSEGALPTHDAPIYLADTLGEMGLWYRLAPVAFMGGSTAGIGGHNPYEPAALGAALIHGPDVANFAAIYAALDAGGGALRIADATGLAEAVWTLWAPPRRGALVDAARRVVAAEPDARDLVLTELLARLPPAR